MCPVGSVPQGTLTNTQATVEQSESQLQQRARASESWPLQGWEGNSGAGTKGIRTEAVPGKAGLLPNAVPDLGAEVSLQR